MSYYVDQIFKTGKDAHTYFDGWFSDQEKKMLSEGTYQDIYHDAPTYLHEVDWFEEYTTCHIKRTEPHDKEWFTMNVWRYVRESIASFLYTINQPLRAHQAVFSNVSIYDDAFLDAMLLDYIFPDGNTPNKETVKEIQRIFLSTMNSEMSRTVYTFPVVTACFAKDKETGELIKGDLFDELPKYAMKYSFVNIYTGDTATLSSCCFGANQSVLTKSDNGVALTPIKDICQEHGWKKYRKNLTVFHNGSWQKAKRVEIPYNNELYKITTSNNKELFVTDDHLHLTMNGDKKTTALTTDDYLAFNVRPLDTFAERDEKLTYAQGFLLGAYLGDGSKYKRKDSESYEVTFSLNANKLAHVGLLEEALYDWGIDKELHIYDGKNNVKFVKFYSKELFDIVNKYIRGSYSHEKEIDMCVLLQSQKFRKGIVDGWYMTDGGNSNRIYTTSKRLIDTGEVLFTSLGMNTIINVSDKTGKATIRNEEFTRNYPLYCIRWYDTLNKLTMKDVYIVKNNTEYFKIKSIEKYEHADTVYCFEMNNSDIPYFTLPNGIMTHNCRLRSDTTNEYFNSFGAGSSKIGSVGVVTVNMPRLAEKCKSDKDKFIDDIKYFTNVCAKVNNAKRHIVRKKIENGNHPLYTLGFADLSRQYSTVGMNGIYEAIEYLGMDITTNTGAEYLLKVLDTVNKTNDMNSKRYTSPHNCEQVPKMCGDVKSYLIDLECHENMVDKGQARQFINVCAA